MAMARAVAGAAEREPAPRQRPAGGVRHRRHLHRRRGRGGRRRPRSSPAQGWASRSPSRPAGATAPRRWTWTRSCPRRSGASTAPSGPGAVYLAAVLAGAQPEGPAGLQHLRPRRAGRAATRSIPADVQEKLLHFARAGLAVATMRGKSYLSHGRRLDGHRRLDRRPRPSSRTTWACASRCVDMSEFVRRIDEGIYDQDEYRARAGLGRRRTARKARTTTRPSSSAAAQQKDGDWETWSRWR